VAGCQHQQKRRDELRESDEAKVERAVRQRIDLPADANGKHLVRDHRGDARKPEEDERALLEE
jgi:hypothetical protein